LDRYFNRSNQLICTRTENTLLASLTSVSSGSRKALNDIPSRSKPLTASPTAFDVKTVRLHEKIAILPADA
jgi:hypothetical protein